MTIWLPNIETIPGPKYRAIAEALAADVAAGHLTPGTRLPTHRDLAWRLGVTVGTVSRAYALAQTKGLVAGEVGRGTVVRSPGDGPAGTTVPADFSAHVLDVQRENSGLPPREGIIEMIQNVCVVPGIGDMLADASRRIWGAAAQAATAGYQGPNGTPAHRSAGASWLRRSHLRAEAESVFVVSGGQHGLAMAFMAVARAGDPVVVEPLTWVGARNLATSLGLHLHSTQIDEFGIVPDAFERICRTVKPKLLYTIPTLQNPTTTVLPDDRRRRIAAIARAHDVTIVEDNVFGFLMPDAPPPIAATDPDVTIHVTGLSKSVTPMLRIGYLHVPDRFRPQIAAAVRATTMMPSFITAQLATELIESGAADATAEAGRRMSIERQELARRILGPAAESTNGNSSHVWLPLPQGWPAAELATAALAQGVAITAGGAFSAAFRDEGSDHVRLSLCAEPGVERVQRGLEIVAGLLAAGPGGTVSVI